MIWFEHYSFLKFADENFIVIKELIVFPLWEGKQILKLYMYLHIRVISLKGIHTT